MKWKGRRRSSMVEDRRGQRLAGGASAGAGAGLGRLALMLFARSSGRTRIVLLVGAVIAFGVFKINPMGVLGLSAGAPQTTQVAPAPDDEMRAFLETLKADNEEVWTDLFRRDGRSYDPARLVIYTERTMTAGGVADAGMGPFYMPADRTIYIDPAFFRELSSRFGAPGDFAQAYVVAHEVGHHVQHLLGNTDRVHSQKGRVSDAEYNQLSVRLELQADFLAGVFAHHADRRFDFLEQGDIEEAMRCAAAIGDDTLQRRARGTIEPESFTHGTSTQRKRWFMLGYRTGDLRQGDTFAVAYGDL